MNPAHLILNVQRTFNAPRSRVFEAWKKPELLRQWPGGNNLPALKAEIDFRVGGGYSLEVVTPAGTITRLAGEYQEIIEPQRIVFTWAFADWDGTPEWTLVTVQFSEQGSKITVTLKHEHLHDAKLVQLHREGWGRCFDRLEKLLAYNALT